MNSPQNPHDRLFKSTFSDKQIATDYLKNFLPKALIEKLDLPSLKLEPTSFINSKLEAYFSDVIYVCQYGEESLTISLLFEHKSQPSGIIYLQLLRYLLEAWDQQKKQKESLRVIVPIVIYHGKKAWKRRSFSSYFQKLDEYLRPFVPEFAYLFTDLQDWDDEVILSLEAGLMKNTMILLKHYNDDEYIQKHFERIFHGIQNIEQDEVTRVHVMAFLFYIWRSSQLDPKVFRKLIAKLPQPLRDITVNTYEKILQEGIQEGKAEGLAEGLAEGILAQQNIVITHAFQNGLDTLTIAKLTELSEEEVQQRIAILGLSR